MYNVHHIVMGVQSRQNVVMGPFQKLWHPQHPAFLLCLETWSTFPDV
jgi:hypothetical protein